MNNQTEATGTAEAGAATEENKSAKGKPAAKKGKTIAEMKKGKAGAKGTPMTKEEKAKLNKELAANADVINGKKGAKGAKGKKGAKAEKAPEEPAPVITLSTRNADEIAAEYLEPGTAGNVITVKKDLPVEEWGALVRGLDRKTKCIGFVIGDLLAYGEKKYTGKVYDAAMTATGCELKTLQNYKSTATRVAPEIRKAKLSFGHHEAVAALPAGTQRKLLEKAEKEALPLSKLRKEVKAVTPAKTPKKPKKPAPAPVQGAPLTASESKAFDAFQDRLEDIIKFMNGNTWKKLTKADRKSLLPNFQRIADAHQAVAAE